MAKQFPEVSAKYGAPMGRREYGTFDEVRRIKLFRVRLDTGGYDDGGAYWGVNLPGNVLYCAESEDARRFVRAAHRDEARIKLGLEPSQLLIP